MSSEEKNVQKMLEDDALAKHVKRFVDKDGFFSSGTVSSGLEKIHGNYPGLKAPVIATFNAIQVSFFRIIWGFQD